MGWRELDRVAHAVAVVDGHGDVVGANSSWRGLTRMGAVPIVKVGAPERENVLAGFETLGEAGWPLGEAVRSVLEGRLPQARQAWQVRGTWQNRWLELDVTPRTVRAGARPQALVQILDITRTRRSERLGGLMREAARSLGESDLSTFHTTVSKAALTLVDWKLASRWRVRARRGNGLDVRLREVWTPSGAVPSEGWNRVQKLDTDIVRRAALLGCPLLEESGWRGTPHTLAVACGHDQPATSVVLLATEHAPSLGDLTDLAYLFQQAFTKENAGLVTAGVEPMRLATVEREHVLALLESSGGNLRKVATWLGISRSTLYEKLRRYGVPYEGRRKAGAADEASTDAA